MTLQKDPEEMREHIREIWSDFLILDEASFSATQSAWAVAGAGQHVRVRLKLFLSCWRKR